MSRLRYKFFLLLLGLLLVQVFLGLDTASTLHTFAGRESQAKLWSEESPARVFFALQLLFLTLLTWASSYILLWRVYRLGSLLWILTFVFQCTYYVVDPRYAESDLTTLLFGLILFLGGVLFSFLYFSNEQEPTRDKIIVTIAALFSFIPFFVLGRILFPEWASQNLPLEVVLPIPLYIYLAGVVAMMAYRFGQLEEGVESTFINAPTFACRSLFLLPLAYTLVCVAILAKNDASESYLGFVAPAVPVVMSVYAPYTWFQADQATEIFSSIIEEEGKEAKKLTRAKLYVGLFFQYLTLAAVVCVFFELKRHSKLRFFFAHLALLAYFLPSFWLAQTTASLM